MNISTHNSYKTTTITNCWAILNVSTNNSNRMPEIGILTSAAPINRNNDCVTLQWLLPARKCIQPGVVQHKRINIGYKAATTVRRPVNVPCKRGVSPRDQMLSRT